MKKQWKFIKDIFKKHYLYVLLLVLVLLSGCGQTIFGSPNANDDQLERNWPTGHGELHSIIGTEDERNPSIEIYPDIPLFMDEEFIDHTEYAQPTGKWFFHKDQGQFGYGISAGTKKAEEEYSFHLSNPNERVTSLDRNIRIQLTERDENLQKQKLIEEEVIFVEEIENNQMIFSNRLPAKNNIIYMFSAEILDEENDVEDTLVSLIYVPMEELNAKLYMDQETFQASDREAILTLKNYGPTFIDLGTYYTIEKNVHGTWRVVPLDLLFEDIGIHLRPNAEYEQKIDLEPLTKGHYRVVKDIHGDGTNLSAKLAVEFTIE